MRSADSFRPPAPRRAAITALTGAGVSAASGIPTFRGPDGLWKKVRAETLATPEAFENDPKLVWEWYDWRRGMITSARPNAAHEVLARWTRERPELHAHHAERGWVA